LSWLDVIKPEEEFIRHIIIRVNASSIIRPDVTLLSYATFFHFRTIPHRSVRNGVNARGSRFSIRRVQKEIYVWRKFLVTISRLRKMSTYI